MPATHNVQVYFVVRAAVAVEATDHQDALKKAAESFDARTVIASGAFDDAEEIAGYLVDEVGDADYSRSRDYTADFTPDR